MGDQADFFFFDVGRADMSFARETMSATLSAIPFPTQPGGDSAPLNFLFASPDQHLQHGPSLTSLTTLHGGFADLVQGLMQLHGHAGSKHTSRHSSVAAAGASLPPARPVTKSLAPLNAFDSPSFAWLTADPAALLAASSASCSGMQ